MKTERRRFSIPAAILLFLAVWRLSARARPRLRPTSRPPSRRRLSAWNTSSRGLCRPVGPPAGYLFPRRLHGPRPPGPDRGEGRRPAGDDGGATDRSGGRRSPAHPRRQPPVRRLQLQPVPESDRRPRPPRRHRPAVAEGESLANGLKVVRITRRELEIQGPDGKSLTFALEGVER